VIARGLVVMVRGYQVTFGALLPPVCRYEPSCSRYSIQALQRHGAVRGGWLTVRRLVRCNPWGGMGYDPVPD
jgi:uncharacterized protein